MAVRNGVGMFDVSHMGEFIVKGNEALKLVQSLTSNDASKLNEGDIQYSCMPNHNGGIVDDLLVYRLFGDNCSSDEQAFMLVVNASNIKKDWDWIISHNKFGVELIDISEKTGLIALQGPRAVDTLRKLTDMNVEDIAYYKFRKGKVAGLENVLVSATGYTGSGGFELYVKAEDTAALWESLVEAGKEFGLRPCGLGSRDTLRLEMGFCLYGNDIDDNTSPLEAGLGWITKLNKDFDFPSKQYLIDQKESGVKKKLVGFVLDERRVPRHGYTIYNMHGDEIGVVTSGTQSPSLNQPIGMGYVNVDYASIDNQIQIGFGNKLLLAKVVKIPFYKK
jgi:aminomethyltransferase